MYVSGENHPRSRPTLRTARLVLRPLLMTDAPALVPLAGDTQIAANTLLIPHPYGLGDAERWIAGQRDSFERGESLDLAICLADGTIIGAVGMGLKNEHLRAEIGYWIGVPWWGHGYATEAAGALIDYAFETLGLYRVYAYHYAQNPASGRVLQKVGMTREGVQRAHIQKWGRAIDCVAYGILRPEWEAARGGRPASSSHPANNRP